MAPRCSRIHLWIYEPDLAERVAETRQNDVYLPGFTVPPNVQVGNYLPECLDGADAVLGVMPSHLARDLYRKMLPSLTPEMLFVSATKGLESLTLLRVSQVIHSVVSERFSPRVGILSGPTFAREVAAGSPTAVVVASENADLAHGIQAWFSGPTLRLYTSGDPTGVELGGALKNVVALGAGVCSGLSLGHNTLAALITRGLAEMTRLAVAMGGHFGTLSGLAGLGDLILTCTGDLSRNRQVGIELARGRPLDDIVASMRMVAEGIKTAASAAELGRRYGVDLPIVEQMHAVLEFGRSPAEALRQLMERTLKGE
ncbi:MAG: NAD(P)-dependent glycerol-3-phosphate dehydrogenase [Acidobacteriota bacterium]|nr:NAD(P)-dependent glycerol-3-phosphate dehydrogenase [Acidobacteriota bacterium]